MHEAGKQRFRTDDADNVAPETPFALIVVDHATRFGITLPLKTKADASTALQQYILKEQNLLGNGKKLKYFVCDSGTEFLNSTFLSFLQDNATTILPSPPHTHELNGVAERRIQEVSRIARTFLLHAGMNRKFYFSALQYAMDIVNITPNAANIKRAPPTILRLQAMDHPPNKLKVDLARFHTFGSRAWVLNANGPKSSLSRADASVFLGFDPTNGYPKCLSLKTGYIRTSRNVTFEDDIFPLSAARPSLGNTDRHNPTVPVATPTYAQAVKAATPTSTAKAQGRGTIPASQPVGGDNKGTYIYDDFSFSYYNTNDEFSSSQNALLSTVVPAAETKNDPNWDVARAQELHMLRQRGTFSVNAVVPPRGARVLRTKFVYATKTADNTGFSYKARLVALGFTQRAGIDFGETYSPVVHLPTVRLVTGFAAQHNLKTKQIDVLSAYLNAPVKEEIYLQLPAEIGGEIVKLHKSIYGLKQAGCELNRVVIN